MDLDFYWRYSKTWVEQEQEQEQLLECKRKVQNINLYLQLIIKIAVANQVQTNKFYNLFGTELTFCITLYSTWILAYCCRTSKRGRMIHTNRIMKIFVI